MHRRCPMVLYLATCEIRHHLMGECGWIQSALCATHSTSKRSSTLDRLTAPTCCSQRALFDRSLHWPAGGCFFFVCVRDEVGAEWNKRSGHQAKNFSPYTAKTGKVSISAAMTKCLHEMMLIQLLVGFTEAPCSEDDVHLSLFLRTSRCWSNNRESWKDDPTRVYTLHWKHICHFHVALWGRTGDVWTGTLSDAKCTHIISTRQSFRSRRSTSPSVKGRVKVPLYASSSVCLSWLTMTAAFRRLHGSNSKVPKVKAVEGLRSTSWTKSCAKIATIKSIKLVLMWNEAQEIFALNCSQAPATNK